MDATTQQPDRPKRKTPGKRVNLGARRMTQVGDKIFRVRLANKATREVWYEGTYTTIKAARGILGRRKAENIDPETGDTLIEGSVEVTRTIWKNLEEN